MSIRLSAEEAWAAIEAAHTGILTTLRSDGRPVTLPVWFVVDDRTVCISTPPGTKKVRRIRHDPRASFLIESGKEWRSLTGVHLSGAIHEVTDEPARTELKAALNLKYQDFRLDPSALPESARDAYAQYAILRLVPEGRVLTWDNSRMKLNSGA